MKRITSTILTNMCMVCDGENILVQDKINSSYTGVTFPGGRYTECFYEKGIEHMK